MSNYDWERKSAISLLVDMGPDMIQSIMALKVYQQEGLIILSDDAKGTLIANKLLDSPKP